MDHIAAGIKLDWNYMAMLVTPETILLYGTDKPILERESPIGTILTEIAKDLGYKIKDFKVRPARSD